MKFAVRYALPVFILVLSVSALTYVLAQPVADVDKPYAFKLDAEVTATAGATVIEPKFNGIDGDRYAYEIYFNATRTGTTRDGAEVVDSFRRVENWIDLLTLRISEDSLDGRKDLQMRLQFDQINFLFHNGESQFSGYVGPQAPLRSANFTEILPDGTRNDVTNIPGLVGVTAGAVSASIADQSRDFSASAWFNVADTGRLYNELYYAAFDTASQANYPGKLQDPVHLALGLHPEFSADTKLKIGETTTVRRRFPVGIVPGSTMEYDVTYKLEKLYGTVEKPTAARLSFEAVPVMRGQTTIIGQDSTTFDAPTIKGGELLLDLNKGISAYTRWEYKLSGKVSRAGSELATDFEVQVDFTASLRDIKE